MAQDAFQGVPLRSALGRVRGKGSARGGTHHWFMQRVTSVALLPLMLWFTLSVATLAGASHAETVAWIGRPVNALLLLASIALAFHHTAAGLQVILEDYLHKEWQRLVAILLAKGACWLAAIAAAFAVLRIAL